MQLQSGTYLQGDKYRIIKTLGNGGFGITYLAEHELAGRNVCIKEFFPKEYYNRDDDSRNVSLGSNGSAEIMGRFKEKFIKEAKTIARLDHLEYHPYPRCLCGEQYGILCYGVYRG